MLIDCSTLAIWARSCAVATGVVLSSTIRRTPLSSSAVNDMVSPGFSKNWCPSASVMTTPLPPLQLTLFAGADRVTCLPFSPPSVTSFGPVALGPRIAATAFTKSSTDVTLVPGSSVEHGSENSSGESSRARVAGPSLPKPSAVLRKTTYAPGSSLFHPAGTVTDTETGKGSEVTYLPASSVAVSSPSAGNGLVPEGKSLAAGGGEAELNVEGVEVPPEVAGVDIDWVLAPSEGVDPLALGLPPEEEPPHPASTTAVTALAAHTVSRRFDGI